MNKVLSKNQIEELKAQILYIFKPTIEFEFSKRLKNTQNIPKIKNTTLLNCFSKLLGYNSFSELNVKYSHGKSNEPIYLQDMCDKDSEHTYSYFKHLIRDFKNDELNFDIENKTITGLDILEGIIYDVLEYNCLFKNGTINFGGKTFIKGYPYCSLINMYDPDYLEIIYNDDNQIAICHTNDEYENLGNITPYFDSIEEIEEEIKINFTKYLKLLKYKIFEE
jgi:hypothetical protein